MEIRIIKGPIKKTELQEMTEKGLWDFVKAVVDEEQGIMAIGGEFHADEETVLMEKEGSKREHIWGINVYPARNDEQWIEFDSLINFKPAYGNRSRSVENLETQEAIKKIVRHLIIP